MRAAQRYRTVSPPPPPSPATDRAALRFQRLSIHANTGDLHRGVVLPMSLPLLVLLLALVVEHQHLVAAVMLHHFAGYERRRGLGNLARSRTHSQHIVKLHVFAAGLRQLLDLDYVSGCDAILLSPGADHRVHGNLLNFILLRKRNGTPPQSR